jgi:hypothetical protein
MSYTIGRLLAFGAGVLLLASGGTFKAGVASAEQPANVYQTYGVHNPPSDSPCQKPDCIYTRTPGEPSDPRYPAYWTSHWKMYRVFNSWQTYPPPYDLAPPLALKPGRDYETSNGETFYDDTWRGRGGQGAMMEHYDKRCLPIFPISNHFTCSFISLGDTAFFVTYPQDRPKGMPPVCLFSPLNHPPRPDFIKHLPYSGDDSRRLAGRIQGYSFWISAADGKVVQVGVAPVPPPKAMAIMFGYGFQSEAMPDRIDRSARPYRHPQSFYFSGYPLPPPNGPNAPFVSQNYTDFAMIKPDPKATWGQVSGLDPKTLPPCQLFDPPSLEATAASRPAMSRPPTSRPPTWGDLQRH